MKKKLIILVCYLSVNDELSYQEIQEHLSDFKRILDESFDNELQENTNTIIKSIVLPVHYQPTSIECIFPTEPDLPEEVIERLEQIELTQKNYDEHRSKD